MCDLSLESHAGVPGVIGLGSSAGGSGGAAAAEVEWTDRLQ